MFRYLYFTIVVLFLVFRSANATMSITAVDPKTGKVGSAGFTCLCNRDLSNSIGLVVPGKGAFNSQASRNLRYFPNVKEDLQNGLNAGRIINYNLREYDIRGDTSVTQILSSTLAVDNGAKQCGVDNQEISQGESAYYDGLRIGNVRYARDGGNFAIAGNILISKSVVDDAYNAFNNTQGELEDKLMAALEAAKRVGADSRCSKYGTSSLVAYIKVAEEDDSPNDLYLNLQKSHTYCSTKYKPEEPIDVLKRQFAYWKAINIGEGEIMNLASVHTDRLSGSDNGYTLNGRRMIYARSKLTNYTNFNILNNFHIDVKDLFVSKGNLTRVAIEKSEIDTFFLGTFGSNSFTSNEINELYSWSQAKDKFSIIAPVYNDGFNIYERWGYVLTKRVNNPNYVISDNVDENLLIMSNGDFGVAKKLNQGGSIQGYFSSYPSNSITLVENASGNPTIMFDCNTHDLMLADVDFFTDLGGGMSKNSGINTDAEQFWANLMVFAKKLTKDGMNVEQCR